MDIIHYYNAALNAERRPALLEFSQPLTGHSLAVCAIDPLSTLEVKGGRLYKDGEECGSALEIFDHLMLPPAQSFFPAFIGYFSYEFSSYLGKPAHDGERLLPDAFFRRYERGVVIDDGHLTHHDPIQLIDAPAAVSMLPQELRPALSQEQFFDALARIKALIRAGDVYQVNFSMPLFFEAQACDMTALYKQMRESNKSPFMGIMADAEWSLLSGSPERLFSYNQGQVTARPIAGTKKRGTNQAADDAQLLDLSSCPKERAEHAMLVDLMRNDLHRIAQPKTLSIEEDRTVEFYSHVMHLVSELRAQSTLSLKDLMTAIFPGGTITGAPKVSVMEAIARLETVPRGPYTGSLGYISGGYGIDMNILIRSVVRYGDKAWTNTGAGIVIDSDAEREWEEVHKKASALKDILEQKAAPKAPRAMIKGAALHNSDDPELCTKASVLFLENHDSFSFNIIDALTRLGAQVTLASNAEHTLDHVSHVVIGPGPGNPANMPELARLIQRTLKAKRALLGICLGHQALGHYFGSRVKAMHLPIHGKSHHIHHEGRGLFAGLKQPSVFTRYHSLALDRAPADFMVDAWSEDDHIMAISHKQLPLFGVQFHPESYLSQEGLLLLGNFLRSNYGEAFDQRTRSSS